MAQSRNTLMASIITSIFGNRLGLDSGEYLVGPRSMKTQVADLTSASTATALSAFGLNNILATTLATSAAGGAFTLPNPVPGVSMKVTSNPTAATGVGSTAVWLLRPSTAFYIRSSEGTTMTSINLPTGSAIELTGVTTDQYMVTARNTLAGTVINGTT